MTSPELIAGLLFSVAAQAAFASAEMGLVTASRARLASLAEEGDRRAVAALELLSKEEQMLGTCLIGTNTSVVSATTLTSMLLANFGITAEWAVTVAFVPLALVLGEMLPKTVATWHADRVALVVARPMRLAVTALGPVLLLLNFWGRTLRRLVGAQEASIARQDIVELIEDSPLGDIHPAERRIIRRVLDMSHTTVADCMTALVEVAALPEAATPSEAADLVVRVGHSRIPIYRDRVDHIVGVVHHRALLGLDVDAPPHVGTLMSPVVFVPETKRVDELLKEMLKSEERFAVVVDEYGGSIGVVTLEDLLEEIVGNIQDERDSEPTVRRLGEREWRVPGKVRIADLESAIGIELPDGDFSTVAGLFLTRTGRIPAAGEVIRLPGWTLTVEQATDRAVLAVRIVRG